MFLTVLFGVLVQVLAYLQYSSGEGILIGLLSMLVVVFLFTGFLHSGLTEMDL